MLDRGLSKLDAEHFSWLAVWGLGFGAMLI